jgi:hypothetical protein
MSRRLYHLENASYGLLRITDPGARPRHWQLVDAVAESRFTLALVVGRDEEGRPLVELMAGNDIGYPVAGQTVWFRGPAAERRRLGLPDPFRWWRRYEREAERAGASGRPVMALIDGVRCRVLARSTDSRFVVSAPLNAADTARVSAQQQLDAARIVVLNSELMSRHSERRNFPIPAGSETLQLFGEVAPWTIAVPGVRDSSDANEGTEAVPRPFQHAAIYRAAIPITAHIFRAGPRGGRLIGFEYGRTRLIDGVVAWTGKRDRAIRLIAAEYQRAFWLEYANYLGGD